MDVRGVRSIGLGDDDHVGHAQHRFARVISRFVSRTQRVDEYEDLTTQQTVRVERPKFWTMDAEVGWRLPNRLGFVTLEGTNITDREFDFYEQSLQEQVIPARRVVLRADFQF